MFLILFGILFLVYDILRNNFLLFFGFVIGGAVGGIILIWRLFVAIYYIPLTAVRFVAARG